jgi:hypothetical protein
MGLWRGEFQGVQGSISGRRRVTAVGEKGNVLLPREDKFSDRVFDAQWG